MTPRKRPAAALALLSLILLVAALPSADGPPKGASDPKSAKSAAGTTVKVEKGPFRATVTIKGVFAPSDIAEVALRPEAWTTGGLTVKTAVEAGTPVKK